MHCSSSISRLLCLSSLFLAISLQSTSRAQVIISEFMASNGSILKDDMGQYSDWIEIANVSGTNVNLLGWGLTDKAGDGTPWLFPSTNIAPGAVMVVFATGLDRRVAGATLHTDFKMDAAGEYLGLIRPNKTVATEFSPAFPMQIENVSYGFARNSQSITCLTTGSVGKVIVPANGSLGSTWIARGYDDGFWLRATNGIGYEVTTASSTDYKGGVLADSPLGYWRFSESATYQPALNQGSAGAAANGVYSGAAVLQTGPRPPDFGGMDSQNYAMRVSQLNTYVEVPYTPALNPAGPFTVEAWVKPDSLGGSRAVVSSQNRVNRSSGNRSGYIIYQSTQWEFGVGDASGYIANVRSGAPTVGVWTYVVGVYDGSSISLYVDGELMGTLGLGRPFNPNTALPLRMGRRYDEDVGQLYGSIDEVSIIGRALTGEEIARRYECAKSSSTYFSGAIKTDLASRMYNINSSAYLRLPFVVNDLTGLKGMSLSALYNDGFVAYLNGQQVLTVNAPASPQYNSTALAERTPVQSINPEVFDLSGQMANLVVGTNILAVQAMNVASTNSNFLFLPQLTLQPDGNWQTNTSFFTSPTPKALNQLGINELGPMLTDAAYSPKLPGVDDDIVVTCRATRTLSNVAGLTLYWRVMFGATYSAPMYDDGAHGDGAAGDGVYSATIPHLQGGLPAYASGQMVRWYITASDTSGRATRLPLYFSGTATDEYLGTVIASGSVATALPVIHLFVENYANGVGVDSSSKVGGRAAVYYDGDFYDNVHMYVRGNSTVGFLKKSHSIDFNSAHPFRHPGPGGQLLSKASFTADYPDPSYLRQRLTFWLAERAGAPGPFYHPVRLQMNGEFYQLANHNDLHGEQMLDRIGYDPNGALYNAAGTIVHSKNSTGGFDKKTRQWEADNDYYALTDGIVESLPMGARMTNVFDLLDLPEVISYMTVARFVYENDDVWANMSVYHDNDGDGLWRIIPFDMNLSWGAAYMDSSSLAGLQVTNDANKGHPLYGSSQTIFNGRDWNRLYDVIFQVPQTREMFLRHLRTFLDTWIKQQGDATSELEPLIRQWRDQIAQEAALDRAEWGWPALGGQCNFTPGINLTAGVDMILNQFLPGRRGHFYGRHSVTNTALPIGITTASNAGIPLEQPTNAVVSIGTWDYNPASGTQAHEYITIVNTNNYAVDLTGWKLRGGVRHEFEIGTVIPAGQTLYVTPDVAAFRMKPTAPRGGMGLFVQGNYKGQLSAWGDSFELVNAAGAVVSGVTYTGTPSSEQQYLRITEIMYNPEGAPAINADPQQFEFVELKNISTNVTLNLSNVCFTSGISFNFTNAAIRTLLPGARVLVVRNAAAFAAFYGSGLPVAGEFTGALNNAGENLRLEDAVGEKILDFDYDGTWYPTADGLGFSIVIVDETAPLTAWSLKEGWRASGVISGSPGVLDPQPAPGKPVVVNEVLAHSDFGLLDSVELRNLSGTNVNIGGWFLTDDIRIPKKYRIPDGTMLLANGFVTFTSDQFGFGTIPFAFSEYGEGAYVFEASAQGVLSGFYHGFEFGPSANLVPFGRYETSIGEEHFVRESAYTVSQTNAYPIVGPIVISEIMYAPDATAEEFVELENISAQPVALFCTYTNEPGYGLSAATNTWRLRGGVTFDFPQGVVLGAGQRLLVVGFDPSTNAATVATVRAWYGISNSVAIYGPMLGKLDNSGDSLLLEEPDKPDVTATNIIVPIVLQERVKYGVDVPWPARTNGQSLQRISSALYGDDPINWVMAPPTAGAPSLPQAGPQITSLAANGGNAILTISSIAGRSYVLEYTESLNQASWTELLPAVIATGESLSFTNMVGDAAQRFYRVRVQ